MCMLLLWHPNMSMQYMYINNVYTATKCVNWIIVSDSVMGLLDGTMNSISLYGCYYIYCVAQTSAHLSCKKAVASLPPQHLYGNFILQVKNTVDEAMQCVWTNVMVPGAWLQLCMWTQWQYQLWNRLNWVELPHKNFSWWVVTWRSLQNHRTVQIGGWALAWKWAEQSVLGKVSALF